MNNHFHQLDYHEQVRRFERLARQALAHFGLPDATLELAAYTNNTVFSVQAGTDRYALRMHRPGHKLLRWIKSELMWLRTLSAELRVPAPVGDVCTGGLDGIDTPVHCVLLTWVDGHPILAGDHTPAQLQAVGAFAAQLHTIRFEPPPDFERPTLDCGGLFGADSPYNPGEGERFFTADHQAVMAEVIDQVCAAMEDGPAFGLIHADLIAKNLLFDGQTVGAVDFDECSYGYFAYDLTPMLWVNRDRKDYDAIREAIVAGYNRPLDHLDTFVAARHVASCRWIAGNADHPAIRGKVPDILDHRVDEMKRFLKTGRLGEYK